MGTSNGTKNPFIPIILGHGTPFHVVLSSYHNNLITILFFLISIKIIIIEIKLNIWATIFYPKLKKSEF